MARIVSFATLLVLLLFFVGLMFHILADFLLPVFLAVVLAVIFGPWYRWLTVKLRGHNRIAAGLTTAVILAIVLIPTVIAVGKGTQELARLYHTIVPADDAARDATPTKKGERDANDKTEELGHALATKTAALALRFGGLTLSPEEIQSTVTERLEQLLAPLALRTTQLLSSMVIGLLILIITVYYFFADGPAMLDQSLRIIPLADTQKRELLERFGTVTRAVILATFLSALAQAALASIGFYFAGVESLFMLFFITALASMVPFVGTALVWVSVCLWLAFVQDRVAAGIILAIYCGATVSMVDNLVKPFILSGHSNIHPLLALLSVMGGAAALGPIGIFVGPMAAAFLQTLVEMVVQEMTAMGIGPDSRSAVVEPGE